MVFDVPAGAPEGTGEIRLVGMGDPSGMGSVYIIEGLSKDPVLAAGKLQVGSAGPPFPRTFIGGTWTGTGP